MCLVNEKPIIAEWGQWGEYAPCSYTCGPGLKTRERVCENGVDCEGSNKEGQDCEDKPCGKLKECQFMMKDFLMMTNRLIYIAVFFGQMVMTFFILRTISSCKLERFLVFLLALFFPLGHMIWPISRLVIVTYILTLVK